MSYLGANFNTNATMQLTSLILVEAGAYHDQWSRPFETSLNSDVISVLDEKFNNQRNFSANIFAPVSNQFIAPQAQPEALVPIQNGWANRRARFVLTVETIYPTGDRLTEMVLGYTDGLGFHANGAIDPNMQFHINSVHFMRQVSYQTPQGMMMSIKPTEASQVLSNEDFRGLGTPTAPKHLIRPEDIYSTMDLTNYQFSQEVYDTRTALGMNAVKSKRSNAVATDYMARMLDSRSKAIQTQEMGAVASDINIQAQGYITEPPAMQDDFIRVISRYRGANRPVSSFSYRELLAIDPTVDQKKKVRFLTPQAKSQTDFYNYSNPWTTADWGTQVATILGNAVPALLMECGLSKAVIQATNQTPNNQFVVTIPNMRAFANVDTSSFAEKFKLRFVHEVLMGITNNGRIDISLEIHSEVIDNTMIRLLMAGTDWGSYNLPSFCDSTFSPVVTTNQQRVQAIAHDFNNLLDRYVPISSSSHQLNTGYSGSV